jgi:hypothetical protein
MIVVVCLCVYLYSCVSACARVLGDALCVGNKEQRTPTPKLDTQPQG